MDAAERSESELVATDPLTWAEICANYPDQFVCLIEIVSAELGSPEIKTARVVGHASTRRAAFDPIRDRASDYPRHAVRFTGNSPKPLIRPTLVIDDEALQILRS
jgi:hypothetical protein